MRWNFRRFRGLENPRYSRLENLRYGLVSPDNALWPQVRETARPPNCTYPVFPPHGRYPDAILKMLAKIPQDCMRLPWPPLSRFQFVNKPAQRLANPLRHPARLVAPPSQFRRATHLSFL